MAEARLRGTQGRRAEHVYQRLYETQGREHALYCSEVSTRNAIVMALMIGMLIGGLLLGWRLVAALFTSVYPNV